jgi:hypothetical protein
MGFSMRTFAENAMPISMMIRGAPKIARAFAIPDERDK